MANGRNRTAKDVTVRKHRTRVRYKMSEINKQISKVSPLSLFGASAMGFPDKISTVRSGMATRHTSQRVVLEDPEFSMIYTGAENIFGKKSSWNISTDDEYELMKIFRKFKGPVSPVLYVLRNTNTGKYKCSLILPAINLVEKYGFRMNNMMDGYVEGDILPKDTPIAQTSSYVDGNYCAGRNMRSIYAVLPELTEDALVISEDAAHALRYNMVDKKTVNLGKNSFLLNKYGNDVVYKPFPDVGDDIVDDIICSIRENAYMSSVSEASIPHMNDINYFSNGTVVDIDIFTNVDVENDQFNYYLGQIRDFYSDIYAYISTIVSDPSQDDCSLIDIYHKAEKYLNDSTWVTDEYIADTIIEFTVLQPVPIRIGQKFVGRYGNKSVVSEIIPTHLMPKTEDGRPIDFVQNALSVPNRIIAFATEEGTITFQMERMTQHIRKLHDENVPQQDIMNLVIEFVSIYTPDNAMEISRLYRENPNITYKDIIDNGIYIQIKPLNEICMRDAILEVYDRYPDIMKKYDIYTKLRHRWIKQDEQCAVGYQYIWVLKQEPSKAMSAVATGRTTLYDNPVKTRQYNKGLRHYSNNPIKFGEYDTYNMLAGVGVRSYSRIITQLRGSQYTENSMLISQLNNMNIDVKKYNNYPQLDNLKNVLKLFGVELKPDVFGYNTIGSIDEEMDIFMNNVNVRISIPDLRYILIMYSYYIQYEQFVGGTIDMIDFFNKIRNETDLFTYVEDQLYIERIFERFVELFTVLQQLKQYD